MSASKSGTKDELLNQKNQSKKSYTMVPLKGPVNETFVFCGFQMLSHFPKIMKWSLVSLSGKLNGLFA